METSRVFDSLSPEEMVTYQEQFSFFDKEDSGTIPISSIPLFMRGLGHCPTDAQLKKIFDDLGEPTKKTVTFNEVVTLLTKRVKQENIEDEIVEAFEGFGKNYAGKQSEDDKKQLFEVLAMKKSICNMGQAIPESEFDVFLELIASNGLAAGTGHYFNYRNLAKILAYSYMQQ